MGQPRDRHHQHRRKQVLYNAVDLTRHRVNTHIVICSQNAQNRGIRADIKGRCQRGCKDDEDGLEVLFPVDLSCQPDGAVPPGPEKIEHIGTYRRKHRDACIDAVVIPGLDEGKQHENGQHLKQQTSDGDIGILLKDREHPFGADGRKEDL